MTDQSSKPTAGTPGDSRLNESRLSDFQSSTNHPPGIVSVNKRGGASSGLAAKLAFGVVSFALVVIGALFAVNKWRSANHADDAATAAAKTENRPAQVGQRRAFSTDPVGGAAASQPRQPSATAVAACADGSAGIVLLGSDGKPMSGASGEPMRACADGRVLVPPIQAQSAASGASGGQQAAKPPSRYAGDVLVPAPVGFFGQSAGSSLPPPPAAAMQSLGMLQELLNRQQAPIAPATLLGGASPAPSASPNLPGSIGSLLTPSSTPMVQAALLGDRSLILPKGRPIDCAMTTRVVTDVAGLATCVISADVFSDNGRTLLIEKGSEAVGEYAAAMSQGQRRLFVLWSRLKTREGVVINVASPATDALGASGIDGFIDNHWWERLSAAFMLSLVQDAIAYKTAAATGDGGSQGVAVFQNTAQSGNRMAEKVLDSTINIKPTLFKNQGDRVAITVARDLDFGTVYALRPR